MISTCINKNVLQFFIMQVISLGCVIQRHSWCRTVWKLRNSFILLLFYFLFIYSLVIFPFLSLSFNHTNFPLPPAGHPTPRAVWDKDSMKLHEGGRYKMEAREETRTLEIPKVTQQDAGLYRVTIENDLGREQATARLDVISECLALRFNLFLSFSFFCQWGKSLHSLQSTFLCILSLTSNILKLFNAVLLVLFFPCILYVLVLIVLVERQCEFQLGVFEAFARLKTALTRFIARHSVNS